MYIAISDRLSMTNTLLICLPKNVPKERFKVKLSYIQYIYCKIQCTCYALCHFNNLKPIFSQHNLMLVYYFRYTDEILFFLSKTKVGLFNECNDILKLHVTCSENYRYGRIYKEMKKYNI